MLSLKNALRLLLREGDDGKPAALIDLSPGVPDSETEIRVVRDGGHIGGASGGDRVRVAKFELEHPPVLRILLTEDEFVELKRNQAAKLIRSLEASESSEGRAAYARQQQQIAARKKREEDERLERSAIDKERSDLEEARLERMASKLVASVKK